MQSQRILFLKQAISESSDDHAFEELFRNLFPGLLSYTTSLIKDKPAAEEICIDVFLKLWQNRGQLSKVNNLSHYLYISAKNAAISYLRSKGYKELRRNISIEEAGEHFEYELSNQELKLINKETMRLINDAINSLPPKCRLIFRLIKEDGLKYAEAATLLDVSVKTVENQMSIAMKKLTEILAVKVSGRGSQKF
ncbi:MAG TPA: RNA polymerase sigma-70 factor [Niabella sp.]|nr:RNA polymerase sigma-70 factor [Niabella sp.]HOZ97871.1 RNA polymerase sigma-70 factor [Niabella sp.]HQW13730.1 RNA polymerase sigma-70 factor [Niabella sp.]HQX19125.1 RNA polymerase sigma-70 factor [Niabella sp.]HQX41287.1 RNA polymerase sigma-70 factor [Niabella sp.]